MATEKRLIDANALKSEYEWLLSVVNPCSKAEIRDSIERIDKAPTVDAVEVVRCKDCLWAVTPYGDEGDGFIECTNIHGRPLFREDSFCSYGERKDNG